MGFKDVFKRSFLEGFEGMEIGAMTVATALGITCALALYLFFVYRIATRRTFYSKSFNISLAGIAVITAAIILTIQTNLVVSLGMVGALSIVRFRTAIKDPMDLMFLFWSICIGIICGAGHAEIAVILSVIMTVGILVLNCIPVARAPMILVVNASDPDAEACVLEAVRETAKHPVVKSRNLTATALDLTIEVRTNEGARLARSVMDVPGVVSAALLSHDGEVTF